MTFEEMQAIIERMLVVQRDLQNSQLRALEQSKQTERSIRQMIVYSLSARAIKRFVGEQEIITLRFILEWE